MASNFFPSFHLMLKPYHVVTCIFAADLSAAQRRSILGHKNFRDFD